MGGEGEGSVKGKAFKGPMCGGHLLPSWSLLIGHACGHMIPVCLSNAHQHCGRRFLTVAFRVDEENCLKLKRQRYG